MKKIILLAILALFIVPSLAGATTTLVLTASPETANVTQSAALVPATGGVPTSGNSAVDAATAGLTPVAVTLQNTGDTASVNVRISPVGAGSHIQLWAKDSNGNWYDINVVGWMPPSGMAIPAGHNATDNVYIFSDAMGSYPVTINLVALGDGSTVATVSGTIVVTAPVVNSTRNIGYTTIQAAITDADPEDTINVSPGTYVESGQIHIDKNLTITGESGNKAIIQPSTNFSGTTAVGSWWLVDSGVTFSLSNVVLDGGDYWVHAGLRSHGTTTIDGVDFRRIRGSLSGSPYAGMAVLSFGGVVPGGSGFDTHAVGGFGANLTVINSTFADIGRIGVLVKGTSSAALISNNTYTGKGDGTFLDYAIEFGAGGSGTVSGNRISGNRGIVPNGNGPGIDSTSAGILVTEYYGSGTSANVTNNIFSNNSVGLHIGYLSNDRSAVTARGNDFSGESIGIKSTATAAIVNAENNWWGTASSTEITAKISGAGTVDFTPWYAGSDMTTVASVVSSSETTSEGLTVTIPEGTVVTGNSTWDGTITPPATTTAVVTIPGYTTSVTSAIAIGSSGSDLTFDKAVKLTFAGQAGKRVGWINTAGTFAEITNTCSANDQTAGDALAAGTDCKIDAGTDLVVWTKHFTTFVTYTQTAIPTPPVGGGGGYFVVVNTPASPMAVLATGLASNTSGQVLGATVSAQASGKAKGEVKGVSAFAFVRNLRLGSRGMDVEELQKMLIAEGYLNITTTTQYFGPLTRSALAKWQKDRGLPSTGYFGPMSRAVVLK